MARYYLQKLICQSVLLLGALAPALQAQNVTGSTAAMFPFVLPWDDASPTALDVSFLNDKPAGKNGFVRAQNSHFIDGTGKRMRFVGVNITFSAAFPSRANAEKTAARLAKFGINVVRIHYIDASNYGRSTIWDATKKDHRHLDPAQLDKLDYFIAQLKRNGIYTNINLHVARKFKPEDGFPASVNEIPFEFDKRVDYFEPRMIELQKEYARALLTHVNPYTKTAYASEPAILCVEINNENAPLWFDNGAGLKDLPSPFSDTLKVLWNTWLARRYDSTGDVKKVWSLGDGTLGPSLLPVMPQSWKQEAGNGVQMTVTPEEQALKIEVSQTKGTDWHAQIHQTGLSLEAGQSYTLSFQARSPDSRSVNVAAMLDQPDWRNLGLRRTVKLSREWKAYRFTFVAHDTVANHDRLSFAFGAQDGTLWLRDVALQAGAPELEFKTGETLETRTLPLSDEPTPAQQNDWMLFLSEIERDYARSMYDYLKKDLGVRSLVTCSQVDYGGVSGLYREAQMDYVDKHAYWDHPQTPQGWVNEKLEYHNTPMTPQMGHNDVLSSSALWRVSNKPFAMSEYNHPFPNEYQVECLPLLATFAARQNWDAIYLHEYGWFGSEDGDAGQKTAAPFIVGSNPAKWAFLPSAALLFRQGLVAGLGTSFITRASKEPTGMELGAGIRRIWDVNPPSAMETQLAVEIPSSKYFMNSAENNTNWQLHEAQTKTAYLSADAPAAKVLCGYIGNREVTLPELRVKLGAVRHNFAALTITAMDGKRVKTSSRVLCTLLARSENSGQQWRADGRALEKWGTAPTLIEVPAAQIEMETNGPRTVWALDQTGQAHHKVLSRYENGRTVFTVSRADRTPWFIVDEAELAAPKVLWSYQPTCQEFVRVGVTGESLMLLSLGLVLLGILLLVAGGEVLLRGAVGMATLLRLTPAVIGLTVVAAGTSVPELAVSGIAATQGKAEIAVANVIGSNIFNITVIIGLCVLIQPLAITSNTIKLEYPVLMLVTLLCLVIAQDGEINRLDAALCLAVYVGFTAYLVSLVRGQVTESEAQELEAEVQQHTGNQGQISALASVALVAAGAALLAGGAHATVTGAVGLARLLGWSERIIGLTIVSIGTGLPEVVASVVSSLRGRGDVAIGNIIGSNLFNILCILGISAMFAPLPVQPGIIASDAWWMLGVTMLLFVAMLSGLRLNRWEGGLLLLVYGVYLGVLLMQ
jgi:K+-dependent Na+/Ca+ exchanger-like protein